MRICVRVTSLLIDDRRKDFHGEQNGLPLAREIFTWQRQTRACVYGRCGFAVCTPELIVSPVARIVPTVRVAIPLALRGKARRMPYTDGWRTCVRRLLAVGVTAGKHGNNL